DGNLVNSPVDFLGSSSDDDTTGTLVFMFFAGNRSQVTVTFASAEYAGASGNRCRFYGAAVRAP
ncbi:MAG: hypothetical protein M3R70_00415, partial [Actinomycetota bacterium]|nr:hypothetical protein [Actinomycetota bacterium]